MYLLGFGHKSLPPGRFSCGIYWPKTTCVKKKSFEILPDNHYGIFEKTQCPWVNEMLQAVGLASGENSFALNCSTVLLPFLCCAVSTEQAEFSYLSLSHLASSSRENGDEELSKDLSPGAQGSFDSFEPELQAKCVSEAVRCQNTWVRTMKYGCCWRRKPQIWICAESDTDAWF